MTEAAQDVLMCYTCHHIIGKRRDDGRIEIKHRGIVIRAPYCDIVCPRCGTATLDVGKLIAGALQHCR